MQLSYRATARFLHRHFIRLAWTTTQQRWTTVGALFGLIFALFLPGFGIASAGRGLAGWIVAVPLFVLLFGLAGNRFGIAREKAAALRKAPSDTVK